MKLRQRLSALEKYDGQGLSHVVLWSPGQSFDKCLANSQSHRNASDRLLIEVNFYGGPALTDAERTEQAKAHAWANEMEAA